MVDDYVISEHKFDFILMASFMILLLFALYVWSHDDYFIVKKRALELLADDGTHFVVNYELNSTVYSAQNDITINTTAWATTDFLLKHQNDDLANMKILYIYFLGSSTHQDIDTPNGTFEPTLIMEKGPDGRFHGGPYVINYQEEGAKCTLLSTKRLEYTVDLCGETQLPFIQIHPVDSVLQYKNNKLIASLTWVLVAFSLIAAKDPLYSVFFRRAPKKDQTSNDKGNKNKTIRQKCIIREWFGKIKHAKPKPDDKNPEEDKKLD